MLVALILDWLVRSGIAIHHPYIGDAPLAPLSAIFDANWYINIADSGYSALPDISQQQNYHFFPLYPFLIRLTGELAGLGGSRVGYAVIGVILSHLFFFISLILLYRLSALALNDSRLATLAVWVLAVFPSSYVFSMTYAESLFLMLSLGAALVAYTIRRRPPPILVFLAGLLAALATLTRPQGFLVAALVVWFVAVSPPPTELNFTGRLRNAALAGVPAALALGSFALYIGVNTGNLWAVLQSSAGWGRGWFSEVLRVFTLPPANPMWFADFLETIGLITWTAITLALLFQTLGKDKWERKDKGTVMKGMQEAQSAKAEGLSVPWPFVIYASANLALTVLSNPSNGGWGRYLAVVFPCIWLVAWGTRKSMLLNKRSTLFIVFTSLQALLLFATVLGKRTP